MIEDSEFGNAPRGSKAACTTCCTWAHRRFTIRGTRFYSGYEGHLIKSRARENRIAYNLIYDGEEGQASYGIDLPNGGLAADHRQHHRPGPERTEPGHGGYGNEKRLARNALYLSHNTFVGNPAARAGSCVCCTTACPTTWEVKAVNNISLGLGLFSPGNAATSAATAGLYPAPRGAEHLHARVPAWPTGPTGRTKAQPAGMGGASPLEPVAEIEAATRHSASAKPAAWSPRQWCQSR